MRGKKAKPTRWADTNTNRVERRPYTSSGVTSRMGRSSIDITCPFCRSVSTAFLWSLSGGGKRCENTSCGALFGRFGTAYRLHAEVVQ